MRNLFPATRLGCRSKLNSWKVNVSLGDHVEVVCKNIERDIGDDLGDFTFVKACILYRLHVRARHFSTIDDQSSRELQSSFGSRASRVTSARREDRVIIQTDHFANCRVGRSTVSAPVDLRRDECDLLAELNV